MNKQKKALIKTYKEMAPAIMVAMIATGLGFLALYTSGVPMISDFGKMLTIGIVISFIIALLFLLPLLFIRDQHFPVKASKAKNKKTNGKFLYHFTKRILKFKYFIIVIAFILAGLGIYFDQKVRVETDIESFMPQDSEALDDIYELRDRMGSTDQIAIVIKSDDLLSDENISWYLTNTNQLKKSFEDEIVQVNSLLTLAETLNYDLDSVGIHTMVDQLPEEQSKVWINSKGNEMVLSVMIDKLPTEELEVFLNELNEYFIENEKTGLDVVITGQAVIDVTMISSLTTGRYTITILGMLAVFLGLIIIYRNPLKALTPLIPITLIVGWSGFVMYLLDIAYTPLTATLGALIIGIGTEFTILIMDRYHKTKHNSEDAEENISNSVNTIGKPILISAITTIGGFSALIISDFEILKNFGIMTVINLVLAIISTLIIMPVILNLQANLTLKFKKAK
ncbi:MAG: MMPL family transporter [Candidatus Izimaplasma sp.]|nr:MMPL family transporter [Candidatus Izimaplasma bacterium]